MRNYQKFWGDLAHENKGRILWAVKKTRMELKKEQLLLRYKTAEVHLLENGDIRTIWDGDDTGPKTQSISICVWSGSTAQTYTLPCDVILWGQIASNLIAAKL